MFKLMKLCSRFSIEPHLRNINATGIQASKVVFNPSVPTIYQDTFQLTAPVDVFTKKSFVSKNGALCAYSGKNTERSVKNSRVVKNKLSQKLISWNESNLPIDDSAYELAEKLAVDYINHKPKLYLVDGYLGWDKNYRLKVRSYCTRTYHALFLRNMLVKPTKEELQKDFSTSVDITLFNAGELNIPKRITGTEDDMITAINPAEQKITILGTQFAGEMKKSLFKMANFILPRRQVLPLRASAFITKKNETCVLIGLPGSGKGALSIHADKKHLLANDQIAWSKDGVSNLQGGVYARILNLKSHIEDQVYQAIKFGAVVQNANPMQNTRDIDFHDASVSQNARLCYPLEHLKLFKLPPINGHPKNIMLMTCDMQGVLPPVAKLTYEQALFFYLNGYTTRMNNRQIDPKKGFATCYSGDSSILDPSVYAQLFHQRLTKSKANVWLINTGQFLDYFRWTRGGYGIGKRIETADSVKIINQINQGKLDKAETYKSKYFNLEVPKNVSGLNEKLLHPEQDWMNKQEYDENLKKLAQSFISNYLQRFEGKVKMDLSKAIPTI